MREGRPLGLWYELLQVLFDQVWVVRSSQVESLGHAFDMGIDDNTGLAEGVPQDDICRFSANAGQGDQLLHCMWDFFTETLGDSFAAGHEMLCFILKEAGGTNESFDLSEIGPSHFPRGSIPLEERWSDDVDPLIGTLGGEDCSDEQFPRGAMVEFHLRMLHRAFERVGKVAETRSLIQ